MPPVAIIVIQAIQAAIAAAPRVIEVVQKGKEFIASLTSAGVITAEQQNALDARVDTIAAAFANGQTPPAWSVEPDPV
jgi:hypothetical protein